MPKQIRDIPNYDRPREKLMKYGVARLEDYELMAILIRTGRKGKSAIDIAKDLVSKNSDKFANTDVTELAKIPGVGPVKACEIAACFELGKRFLQNKKTKLIMSPEDIWHEMSDIKKSKREHFVVFFLDTHNQQIESQIISIGTLNASLVHPREVFELAIKHSAAQIIVAHNHPSGVLEFSIEDLKITEKLKKAGEILGIEVIDHVIVSGDGFLAYSERSI